MASFDVIGSGDKAVAIIEVADGEKQFAKKIMEENKNIKSVLKKTSERKGKLRLRQFKLVAGDKNTEVIHKEYGCLLKLNPMKVYFSPREATERQKIATQVKPNETVLVMFSGISVFSIAIAKKQINVNKIYAVELNKDAHNYALENVRINKLSHKIVPIKGDVKKVCKQFYGKCNRVLMPLPLDSEKFLNVAVKCLKKNGVIHFYSLGKEDNLFQNALDIIDKKLRKLKKKYAIIGKRKMLAYAPYEYKICIDFIVKQAGVA